MPRVNDHSPNHPIDICVRRLEPTALEVALTLRYDTSEQCASAEKIFEAIGQKVADKQRGGDDRGYLTLSIEEPK